MDTFHMQESGSSCIKAAGADRPKPRAERPMRATTARVEWSEWMTLKCKYVQGGKQTELPRVYLMPAASVARLDALSIHNS